MKICLLLFGFMFSLANAQEDTLKEYLQYFPLQTGNYWEYKSSGMYDSIFRDSSAYSVEVLGDTLLPNGVSYRILHHRIFYPSESSYNVYERLDSSTGCLYRYTDGTPATNFETKADSLFAQPGDTIESSWVGNDQFERTVCDSIVNDTALVIPTQLRYMHNIGSLLYVSYRLAKGLGLLSWGEVFDYGWGSDILVYAKIKGVEYGNKMIVPTDSLNEQLAYYPLQTGNYFQYKTHSYDCGSPGPCQGDTSAYSIAVTGDTILANGLSYKTMECRTLYPGKYSFHFYERIDPSTGNVFRYDTAAVSDEGKIDSLFAQPSDTFLSAQRGPSARAAGYLHTICQYVTGRTILGVPTLIKGYWHEGSLFEDGYILANGFGVYVIYDSWDFGYSTSTLVYAKIGDKEYGIKITVDVKEPPAIPAIFALDQNYPNPFNPTTAIRYQLPALSHVTLKVYDVLGRGVATLVNEVQKIGSYEVRFDGSRLPSGIYFYRLRAGTYSDTKKLLILK